MPDIQASDYADLILSTLTNYEKGKWTDLTTTLQDFTALPNLLNANKVALDSGVSTTWQIMNKHGGAARAVGLYGTDNVNVTSGGIQASVPFRHVETSYAFDVREIMMNRPSEARLFELIKSKRSGAWVSLAELLEQYFWTASTSTSDTRPHGIGNFIVYDNSATAGSYALTSALPTGFTDIAGLSPTTYTRWRNGSAKYSTIDNTSDSTNLITLWREAAVKSNYKSLAAAAIPNLVNGQDDGYYTNYAVIRDLEFVLTQQNDNLGNDIASKDGLTMFRRKPVNYVPILDHANQNPVFGIDWASLQPVFLEGNYLRETHSMASGQHNVTNHFVDLTMNIRCLDRRRCFVLSNSASALTNSFTQTTGD